MIKFALAIIVVFCLGCRPSCAFTTDELRKALSADAQAFPGHQHIQFGPMKDGRTLEITTEMVNDTPNVGIDRLKGGKFLIHMGRTLAVTSVFLADAMIVCARFHRPICNNIPDYFGQVLKSQQPSTAPFIEEVFPELKDAAETTRADTAVYSGALTAALQSTMLMVTLHEIGHAALRHPIPQSSGDASVELEHEGEADGFAVYVAEEAEQLAAGIIIPFMLESAKDDFSAGPVDGHPSAVCRMMVPVESAVKWLQQQDGAATSNATDTHDDLRRQMLQQFNATPEPKEMDEIQKRDCIQYLESFANGAAKARQLVSKNTKIESSVSLSK